MPSGRRKEFVVEEALDRALLHFAGYGYSSSLTAVEVAMGIRRQSLYNTFGDKQELYVSCLVRFRQTRFTDLMVALRQADSTRNLLSAAADAFGSEEEGGFYPFGILSQTLVHLSSDSELRTQAEEMVEELSDLLLVRLEEFGRSHWEADQLAQGVLGSLLGIPVYAQRRGKSPKSGGTSSKAGRQLMLGLAAMKG